MKSISLMKSMSEYSYYREKRKFSREYFTPQSSQTFRGVPDFNESKSYELQGPTILNAYKRWLIGPVLRKISGALNTNANAYSNIPISLYAKSLMKFKDFKITSDRKISNIYVVQLKKFSNLGDGELWHEDE